MFRVIVLALVLTGCTSALWLPEYKTERVNGFYVNVETNYLFVTTEDSAYVFAIESQFGEALLLSREVEFTPSFLDFKLDDKNQVTGTMILRLSEAKPSQSLTDTLTSLGFSRPFSGTLLSLSQTMSGRRYTIEGELPLEKLQNEYGIRVEQPLTFTETAGKIVATPAAIIVDTALSAPAVVMLTALVPVMMLGEALDMLGEALDMLP